MCFAESLLESRGAPHPGLPPGGHVGIRACPRGAVPLLHPILGWGGVGLGSSRPRPGPPSRSAVGRGIPWAPSPFPRPSPSVQRLRPLCFECSEAHFEVKDCLSPDERLKKRRHGEVRCVARSHTAGRKGQRARVDITHPCASLLACLTPCVPLGPEGRDLPHSSLPLVCDGDRRRAQVFPHCVSSSPAWPVHTCSSQSAIGTRGGRASTPAAATRC